MCNRRDILKLGTIALLSTACRPFEVRSPNVTLAATPTMPDLPIMKIDAGYDHTLALKSDGTLWAWGHNQFGQLGDGTKHTRNSPTQVSVSFDINTMSAGGIHNVAVDLNGNISAWGYSETGALGFDTNDIITTPTSLQFEGASQVDASGSYSLILKNDGTVWIVGAIWVVDRPDDTATWYTTTSYQQVSELNNIISISAGDSHCMVIREDNTLCGWGLNDFGQLGDGTTNPRPEPVCLPDLEDVVSISAGFRHNLALKADGTVWAWGFNLDTRPRTRRMYKTPVQVRNLYDIIAVEAGNAYSLALKNDGSVWAWGRNTYGQLGDRTTSDHPKPAQVHNLTNIVSIAAGSYHSAALKDDGTIWTWGNNEYGQIGDGTTQNKRLVPVQVVWPDQ